MGQKDVDADAERGGACSATMCDYVQHGSRQRQRQRQRLLMQWCGERGPGEQQKQSWPAASGGKAQMTRSTRSCTDITIVAA